MHGGANNPRNLWKLLMRISHSLLPFSYLCIPFPSHAATIPHNFPFSFFFSFSPKGNTTILRLRPSIHVSFFFMIIFSLHILIFVLLFNFIFNASSLVYHVNIYSYRGRIKAQIILHLIAFSFLLMMMMIQINLWQCSFWGEMVGHLLLCILLFLTIQVNDGAKLPLVQKKFKTLNGRMCNLS